MLTTKQREQLEKWKAVNDAYCAGMEDFLKDYKRGDFKAACALVKGLVGQARLNAATWAPIRAWCEEITPEDRAGVGRELLQYSARYLRLVLTCRSAVDSLKAANLLMRSVTLADGCDPRLN